jgi:hypothetical protein
LPVKFAHPRNDAGNVLARAFDDLQIFPLGRR